MYAMIDSMIQNLLYIPRHIDDRNVDGDNIDTVIDEEILNPKSDVIKKYPYFSTR